jgi:hypothetical protein
VPNESFKQITIYLDLLSFWCGNPKAAPRLIARKIISKGIQYGKCPVTIFESLLETIGHVIFTILWLSRYAVSK